MVDYIEEKCNKIVNIHVPSTVGELFTVIVPPSKTENKNWKILVFNQLPPTPFDLDTFLSSKNRVSENEMDIIALKEFMDDPKHTILPSTIDQFTYRPKVSNVR